MVERILEEKNASTAAAKEFGSLRLNAGGASGASNSGGSGGNNNTASGSGDSGVGGSNNNSCSQSQSGECWISTFFSLPLLSFVFISLSLFPSLHWLSLVIFVSLHAKRYLSHCASCVHWNFAAAFDSRKHAQKETEKRDRIKEMESERARNGDTFLNAHCGSLLHPFTLCYACASLLRFLLSLLLFFFALLFLLPSIGLSVFFFRKGSRIIHLYCTRTLVPLCVWHFSFTFPSQFGQQCLATSKHRVEILHLKNSYMCPTIGAPTPHLGKCSYAYSMWLEKGNRAETRQFLIHGILIHTFLRLRFNSIWQTLQSDYLLNVESI